MTLKAGLAPEDNGRDLSGKTYTIEDWAENVFETSWKNIPNFAAMNYSLRIINSRLGRGMEIPDDEDVLYGKIDGLGFCVHVTEIAE